MFRSRRYIIIDLEATCWDSNNRLERKEIIEIGAALLDGSSFKIIDEYASFVRPVVEADLSDFCTKLTSIRQADVDQADDFKVVFQRFLEWIGLTPFTWCSWGAYDYKQMKVDCRRHNIPYPRSFERHMNIKQVFADLNRIEGCDMHRALELLDLSADGIHHRGSDDALNIARIAQRILPQVFQH